MGNWNHNGEKVYSGNPPTSWTDLNLRTKVGGGGTGHPIGRTLAVLKVEMISGATYFGFREGGGESSRDAHVAQWGGQGCCTTQPSGTTSDTALIVVPTSATGLVEWKASSVLTSVDIWLAGWIEGTYSNQQVFGGNLPSSWTDLDLTTDTSLSATGLTGEALAFLWYDRAGGSTNAVATRPNSGRTTIPVESQLAGCSQGRLIFGKSVGYVMKSDSSGLIEHLANTPVPAANVYLGEFEQDAFVNYDTEVYAAAAPPTTWTSLDLSSYTGSGRALVMLEVHEANTSPGTMHAVAFRADDDSLDYLPGALNFSMGTAMSALNADNRTMVLFETGPTGGVEWIANSTIRNVDLRILGVILGAAPPALGTGSPTGSSQSPGVTVSIDWEADAGASAAGTDISFTDPDLAVHNVVVSGVFQTGYSGTIPTDAATSGTISISTHPDFAGGTWSVSVSIEDQVARSDSDSWSFSVTSANYINRVRSLIAGNEFITWGSENSPDTTGTSFPGPGTFGVDTADFCVSLENRIVNEYRNRAVDSTDGNFYYWSTSSPDTTGTSFPGPGGAVAMTDYVVHEIIYYDA
jgi:hypothetical protein